MGVTLFFSKTCVASQSIATPFTGSFFPMALLRLFHSLYTYIIVYIYIIWHAWWCQLWQLATVKNSSGFIFLTASIPAQLAQSLRKRQTLAFKKLVLRLSKISNLVARHRFRLWSNPIWSSGKPMQKCLPRFGNQIMGTQDFVYDLIKKTWNSNPQSRWL